MRGHARLFFLGGRQARPKRKKVNDLTGKKVNGPRAPTGADTRMKSKLHPRSKFPATLFDKLTLSSFLCEKMHEGSLR